MESKQTATEWLIEQVKSPEWQEMYTWHKECVFDEIKAMEEKQMIRFAEFVAAYPDKNKNADGEMLHAKSKYDGAERTIDLLEQYYKL
jgi:hypothetical protein